MDFNSLNKLLNEFWTPQKCGKHKDIANQHGMLLLKYLKTSPEAFFEFLNKNTFKFQNISGISWSDFLTRSGLNGYLNEGYIEDALKVTTSRPAIGKGEFLFVSSFKNVCFSGREGDLIDSSQGARIEVKGVRAEICGDGIKYKQMNNDILSAAFGVYNTGTNYRYFNRDCARELEELIRHTNNDQSKLSQLLCRLQNISSESLAIAQRFAKLYKYTLSDDTLFNIVGAMQLYIYLKNVKYLLMVNNTGFKCFENDGKPETLLKFFTDEKIKLSSWETGAKGMEIGI